MDFYLCNGCTRFFHSFTEMVNINSERTKRLGILGKSPRW